MASILEWTLMAHPRGADEKHVWDVLRLLWEYVVKSAAIAFTPQRACGNERIPFGRKLSNVNVRISET